MARSSVELVEGAPADSSGRHKAGLLEAVATRVAARESIAGRLVGGAAWSLAGTLVAQGSAFAAAIPLARHFGAATFGKFGIVQGTLTLFALLAGPSLGLTATKYVAQWRTADPDRASRVVGLTIASSGILSVIVSLALLASSDLLATRSFHDVDMSGPLRIGSLCLLFQCYNGAQLGVLLGLHSYRAIFWTNAVRGLGNGLFVLGGALLGGLFGALWGLAATSFVVVVASELAVSHAVGVNRLHRSFFHAWDERRTLVDFSLPATLASLMSLPVTWAGAALVARSQGGFVEVGYFNAANQWRLALLMLPTVLGQPFLPLLCELHARRELQRFRKLLAANLLGVTALTVLPALVLCALAGPIMTAYRMSGAGPTFALRLLSLSAVFAALSAVVGNALLSVGRVWQGLLLNCAWAVVFLGALRTQRPDAVSLAGAYLWSYAVLFVCTAYVLVRANTRKSRSFDAHD